MPVSVINDLARAGGTIAEILWIDRHGINQRPPVCNPQAATVKGRAHPLVRIETPRVSQLAATGDWFSKLWRNRSCAGPGGIDMQPHIMLLAYLTNLQHRIDCSTPGRTDRGAAKTRA